MLFIPILDVFAKLLGQALDPVEVTFMRFVMQILLMTPLVIWTRQWQRIATCAHEPVPAATSHARGLGSTVVAARVIPSDHANRVGDGAPIIV